MLRFIRGVDAVDVLLSSPCASFTVFYAGRYKSFNIKQAIIDDVISQFDKKREDFLSPSLVKQTVATANSEDVEDSYKLEKKQLEIENNFEKNEINEEKQAPLNKTQKGGWNNIKLKM